MIFDQCFNTGSTKFFATDALILTLTAKFYKSGRCSEAIDQTYNNGWAGIKVTFGKLINSIQGASRDFYMENLTNKTWDVKSFPENSSNANRVWLLQTTLKPRSKAMFKLYEFGGDMVVTFYFIELKVTSSLQKESVFGTNKDHLSGLITKLCLDGLYTDVTIKGHDGYARKAHKMILSANTEVFEAMFRHPMQEGRSHEVTIKELDKDGINALLDYLYMGSTDHIQSKEDLNMLAMAEKYDLQHLKAVMAKRICANVTVENAVELYRVSGLYNLPDLRKKVDSVFTSKPFFSSTHYRLLDDPEILKHILSLTYEEANASFWNADGF